MKISKLIEHLEYSLKTYGDMDVVIGIDTNLSKGRTVDVSIEFIQDIPDRHIVGLQNFPY